MKWESDHMEGQPSNMKCKKFLPQQVFQLFIFDYYNVPNLSYFTIQAMKVVKINQGRHSQIKRSKIIYCFDLIYSMFLGYSWSQKSDYVHHPRRLSEF